MAHLLAMTAYVAVVLPVLLSVIRTPASITLSFHEGHIGVPIAFFLLTTVTLSPSVCLT